MNKVVLDNSEYTFDASEKKISFLEDIELNRLLLITNITNNQIIYNFACDGYGGTLSKRVLTLEYDTTLMSDSDVTQIIMYTTFSEEGYTINSNLNTIKKNTSSLNEIVQLLNTQNELIKEMF